MKKFINLTKRLGQIQAATTSTPAIPCNTSGDLGHTDNFDHTGENKVICVNSCMNCRRTLRGGRDAAERVDGESARSGSCSWLPCVGVEAAGV
jgi:hypothetical protein